MANTDTTTLAGPNNAQAPPRKRKRLAEKDGETRKPQRPTLFAPFRALGLITNHVPFVLQTRSHKGATDGPRIHILTCLGKSWALWEGGKMTLLFVGPETSHPISALMMDGDSVWAVAGPCIIKYIRGKEVARMTNPLEISLSYAVCFGSQILALTEDGGRMLFWDVSQNVLQGVLEFDKGFTATTILHPATYLNKVIVGSAEGQLQLWNIRTRTCIHKFELSRLSTSKKSAISASITAMTQSPAVDVIGVGLSSGDVLIYDIRADELVIKIHMDGGDVRALSFRSDGEPILATASSSGHLAIWDLNSGGRLLHLVRGAHDSAITAVEWIPGQPVLVTSGEDNSIKQWLFDSPTAVPRLLKFRAGHHTPPHLIRYYGDDGKQLLTASRDRGLRCTSVVRDSRSFELSQGSLAKKAMALSLPISALKFPPVMALSYSSTRSKDWDDILTAHMDEVIARTWTMQSKRLGKHSLKLQEDTKSKKPVGSVKAVCVSACGNFGLASSSAGVIHMWNMQSGIKRKSFDVGPVPKEIQERSNYSSVSGRKGKERCVTGLATDALNRLVIASTLDGTINFFDFSTGFLLHTLILPSSLVSISLHRGNGLLAVVCDDMVVRVVDIETKRVVRELGGFKGRILDITFSPDSRWLVATSLDSVIRTFDIPTGKLIDAFRTSSVATSIAFSPTSDFLATSHVDSVGIYLWANRAQYSEVSFQGIREEDVLDIAMPSMQGLDEEDEALQDLTALSLEDNPVDVFSTPPKLDGELVTLTLLPRSRWQILLNLDVIQQRNKPKEPPKAPEQAPFFLPTLPGVETRFSVEKKEEKPEDKKSTRRLENVAGGLNSNFYQKLIAEPLNSDYDNFFTYAKELSPAALDLELRSLVTPKGMKTLLNALSRRLQSHRDFEAVQAILNVFLKVHADVFLADDDDDDDDGLIAELKKLMDVQKQESERILELVTSSLGTLGFVRDTM